MAIVVLRERVQVWSSRWKEGVMSQFILLLWNLLANDEIGALWRMKEDRRLCHVIYKGRLKLSSGHITKA